MHSTSKQSITEPKSAHFPPCCGCPLSAMIRVGEHVSLLIPQYLGQVGQYIKTDICYFAFALPCW